MTRFLVMAAIVTVSASAQDWARQKLEQSPRHREFVTVKHDGRSAETFVAYPAATGKAPVVLVIHEIFGLSDWAQEVADEFAAAGYAGAEGRRFGSRPIVPMLFPPSCFMALLRIERGWRGLQVRFTVFMRATIPGLARQCRARRMQ